MRKFSLMLAMLLAGALCFSGCSKEEQSLETKKKVVRYEQEESIQAEDDHKEDVSAEALNKEKEAVEEPKSATTEEVEETEDSKNVESSSGSENLSQTSSSSVDSDSAEKVVNSNSNEADTEVVIPGFNDSTEDGSQQSQQGSDSIGESEKQEEPSKNETADKKDDTVTEESLPQEPSDGDENEQPMEEIDEGFWTDAF